MLLSATAIAFPHAWQRVPVRKYRTDLKADMGRAKRKAAMDRFYASCIAHAPDTIVALGRRALVGHEQSLDDDL
jgi:hypothetical protein